MTWLDVLIQTAHSNLQGTRELEALWSRGVSDEQISSYQIGYLDVELPSLHKADHFLEWCRKGAKLADVFVLPLTNSLGQVKGVQFRHVQRDLKGYMDYFAAKDEPVFFGLAQAMPHMWDTQEVCVVEGAFDLFPMQRVFPATVATLTAQVSPALARLLRRNAREVLIGYDADAPGRKGAEHFIEEHGSDFSRVRTPRYTTVRLSNGRPAKDPSDLWEAMGDASFGVYMKSVFDIR